MGEEDPSKWRVLFLLLSPGPRGKGSPPCSLRRKHLPCLPITVGHPPRYSLCSAPSGSVLWPRHQQTPVLLHTVTGLCSLSEMPLSHRAGPSALVDTACASTPMDKAQHPAGKAIPAAPPAPYLHSVKSKRVKSFLKHEKLITLVFSLLNQGRMRGRKR